MKKKLFGIGLMVVFVLSISINVFADIDGHKPISGPSPSPTPIANPTSLNMIHGLDETAE